MYNEPHTKPSPAISNKLDAHQNQRVQTSDIKPINNISACGIGLEEALKDGNTAIIADTTHFETLGTYHFDGTTLTLKRILALLDTPDVLYHVWAAVKLTIEEERFNRHTKEGLTAITVERFLVELGEAMALRVPGPQLTFVDPRHHNDDLAMIACAKRLTILLERKGVARRNIVISIPATEQGIRAAQELEETYRIHTNLYLVSGLMHAAACAEANASTISIPVGPVLDWHERRRMSAFPDPSTHPGIETIQSTLVYFKLHGIKTKVIGTEFRAFSEISALGYFDAICVGKKQIERLKWCPLPILELPDYSSPASLRARQAQYPTTHLSSKLGFMAAMSAETRSVVAAIVYATLDKLKIQMDVLERVVGDELRKQYLLTMADMKSLYDSPTAQKIWSAAADGVGGQRRLKRRSVGQILGFPSDSDQAGTEDVLPSRFPGIPADMDEVF